MRLILLVFVIFLSSQVSANETVENFDLRSYNPVKNGLKDFTCKIKVEGLTEKLKEDLASIKINGEIFYTLYWLYPGKLDLVVEGLPKGFEELKTNLKNLVVNRVDYLIPQELMKKFRSYQMTSSKVEDGTLVRGVDPTNSKSVNKFELTFDEDGRFEKYKSYSPLGFQESEFEYGKSSWSKNKFILNKSEAKMIQGPQVTEIETTIKYKNFVGYGFPERITIKTEQYIVAPGEDEKKQQRSGTTELLFSDFSINSGVAQNYFRN